ncbi:KAP family P-loop NTPase fold protein [Hoeflea alexandrii]|uniref:KAP family P-loop NTPase fold protein n=1 Tax=Hoeflea alexandrii TaxID=288436 RepID=UPI0022AF27D1|nr:P-loop NTPase fold protein [Hoeflea alexandrii]MCZ4288992.1 P-loop NTPase fold protein [Hoeflea alexandrii]
MTRNQTYSVKGDRALSSADEDKLGFREIAKRIATSLVDRASEEGLVIGVEGSWGSGKSSLLFLIGDELGRLPEDQRPTVINFRPWLIGNRDALITSLFGDLSRGLDRVTLNAGDATRISVAKAKEAGNALRSFMRGLSKAGSAIEVAGDASGFGPIKWIGKGLNALGGLFSKESNRIQLSRLKDDLEKSLRQLNHRFVITIDDVDRLEPGEVIEILRLVRSVIDLPNVIYLLCYDSDILAHSIEKAAKVKSGKSYLEKIVQLTVMVPKPEPFQLRQWFTDELQTMASVKDDDELSRLKRVIDYEGGRQLRTPRSVVRALDAIRFFWPPLREAHADLGDLVWLQLIKDGNPALYRWIEEYCGTVAAVSLGTTSIDDTERGRKLDTLLASVPNGHFEDINYRHAFADNLLGVDPGYSAGESVFELFSPINDQERDETIRNKRLASPDHYRLYFALGGPSHALTQSDFQSIWAAIEADAAEAGMALLNLHSEKALGTLTKADLLLERINGGAYEVLTPQQCENFLVAFSQVMDQAYLLDPFERSRLGSIWDRAERLIPMLLMRLEPTQREGVIKAMFRDGAAIGWLTTLFRSETFAHGRYGNRKISDAEWLFSDGELNKITELMLSRYRDMSAEELFATPDPANLLYAWQQGGDRQGPRDLLQAHIASDVGLIQTLSHLSNTINSSDRGVFRVLRKDSIEPFIDYDAAAKRILGLEAHPDLGARAKQIAVELKDGTHF